MFISKVFKSNKASDKKYICYRLMHSYRVGNDVRQQMLANLGTLEDLAVEKHKIIANQIDAILSNRIVFPLEDANLQDKVNTIVQDILKRRVVIKKQTIDKQVIEPILDTNLVNSTDFVEVDINSIETDNIREIGVEWLAKQALEELGLPDFLKNTGANPTLVNNCLISVIARMAHPSSELETERWLSTNSGTTELFDIKEACVTRYGLTRSICHLLEHKKEIEAFMFKQIQGIFPQEDRIAIYDLTNFYFEGRKDNSSICQYGRSKEKRSDCKLICLALVIDSFGFIRRSEFYSGNQTEPETLLEVIEHLQIDKVVPVIVMDAGIASEDNLTQLREKNIDYVCVSRVKIKNYEIIDAEPLIMQDKNNNSIAITAITLGDKPDNFVHIKSDMKEVKELSMDLKLSAKFEKEINHLTQGLSKKGAQTKPDNINQRIGRIIERNKGVSSQYKIEVIVSDIKQIVKKVETIKTIVTKIVWTKILEKKPNAGSYFIRFSNPSLTQKQVWETYNTIREVEATFRTLKTDLDIRPIHHQKDQTIKAHIYTGIIAYQVVNLIRQKLKKQQIKDSWTTLVQKLNTYKIMNTQMKTRDNKTIFIKYCSRANAEVKTIYAATKYKLIPFKKKKFVVT